MPTPKGYFECGRNLGREKRGKERMQRWESTLIPSQGAEASTVACASVKQYDSKSLPTESIWYPPHHKLGLISQREKSTNTIPAAMVHPLLV